MMGRWDRRGPVAAGGRGSGLLLANEFWRLRGFARQPVRPAVHTLVRLSCSRVRETFRYTSG